MPARWWSLFGSQPLDSLIERALVNSLSVAAAKARLLQVQENLNAQVGSVLYPSVDGKLSTSRNQGNRIKTVTFPLAVFPNNHYPIQL